MVGLGQMGRPQAVMGVKVLDHLWLLDVACLRADLPVIAWRCAYD